MHAPRPHVLALVLTLGVLSLAPSPALAQTSADSRLQSRVEAALAAASDVPSDSITVQVSGGVVTLSGSVVCEGCGGSSTPPGAGTVQQSLGAVVRAVPGVAQVVFRLRYEPT